MFDPVLRRWGMAPEQFWDSCNELQRGVDGYDLEHSYLARLTELGRLDPARRLNAVRLSEWGRAVSLYPGLTDEGQAAGLFKVLKERVPPGQLEIFVVSGGLQPLIEGCLEHHGLRPFFKAVFACRMAEEDPG